MSLKGFFKRLSCGLLKMNCRVWSKLYFGALLSVLLTGVKSTIYYSSLQMSVIMQLSGLPHYWSLLKHITGPVILLYVCSILTQQQCTLVTKLQSSLVICIILLCLLCTLVIGHTACAEQI